MYDLIPCIALAGVVWRMAPLGLPTFWLKYGGSVLWGRHGVHARRRMFSSADVGGMLSGLAALIAVAFELIRLVHAPALDQFRLTLPGALLLGRVFSLSNVVAYTIGIGMALSLHRVTRRGHDRPADINLNKQ